MDASTIISLVTILVTLILGVLSKKSTWIDNKMIPLQNLCIGVVASIIYYFITKDFNSVIIAIGIGTGGAYDLIHNTKLLVQDTDWYKKLIGKGE